jgi:hypothetical protein
LFFPVREPIKRLEKSAGRALSLVGLTWLFIYSGLLQAAVMEVTGFTQVTGATFYNAPANNALTPVTIEGVVVTPQAKRLNESFGGVNSPQFGPDVPGNGAGFGSDSTGFGGATSLMLDFSKPVAAFGVTFVQSQNTADDPSFTYPVAMQVFAGLDCTGAMLGTIIDSTGSMAHQSGAFADFRGLWSDHLDIRSAVISATSQLNAGFQVDGFAISLTTPAPEPLTFVLVGTALIGLGIAWRCTKK